MSLFPVHVLQTLESKTRKEEHHIWLELRSHPPYQHYVPPWGRCSPSFLPSQDYPASANQNLGMCAATGPVLIHYGGTRLFRITKCTRFSLRWLPLISIERSEAGGLGVYPQESTRATSMSSDQSVGVRRGHNFGGGPGLSSVPCKWTELDTARPGHGRPSRPVSGSTWEQK